MTEPACERWMELSDRIAVGEATTEEEARFEREHVAACVACAAEARVWDSLERCLSQRAAPPATLHGPEGPLKEARGGRRRAAAFVGAAAAAIALAGSVALWGRTDPPKRLAPAVAIADLPVSLVLVSGRVEVRGLPAAAGAALRPSDGLRVERGQACLSFARGLAACADGGSQLHLLGDTPSQRRLGLDSGKVVCRLDAQPPGTRFSVEIPQGRVTAKGTVFAVEHVGEGEVAVRVHRGAVELELKDGTRQELRAPSSAVLAAGIRRTSDRGDAWERDERLAAVADLWAAGAAAPVDIAVRPSGARVMLDGIELGESPVSTLVARGPHALAVDHPGYAGHREQLSVRGAERVSRSLELVPVSGGAASSATASAPTAGAVARSPAELLSRARTLRSGGRYAEAATAYQELMSVYPASAEARAVVLSLAQVQLSQLRQPAAALRSFDAYLAGGGALAQEARYGRIRALQELGRTREAELASADFLRDYPGSAQARSLRARSSQR